MNPYISAPKNLLYFSLLFLKTAKIQEDIWKQKKSSGVTAQ